MNTQKLRALPYIVPLFPFDIIVAVCLLVASVVAAVYDRRFFRPRYPKTGGHRPPLQQKIATIQILNWNGRDLLRQCLPSVIDAVRLAGGGHKILLVDNGSTDGSVELTRQEFPQVHILELDRNYGFIGGNNRGVQTVDTEFVVFLNNDMIVDRNFLRPLIDGFTDDSVFAVTSQIFLEDSSRRREETGKTRAKFERGFFEVWHEEIDAKDEKRETIPVFWAGGGSCAFDRAKYLELGGLDELYAPFYLEDTDLSYRAWKRGWKCLLAPASRVIHKHRATSSRTFSHRFVDNTIRRNLYLFIWKNIRDVQMLLGHIINLPRIHGRSIMNNGGAFEVQAYMRAVVKMPMAILRRIGQTPQGCASDRDVIAGSRQ